MPMDFASRRQRASRIVGRVSPFTLVEAGLIVGIVWASVSLIWTLVRPMGPIGRWQTPASNVAAADPGLLTRFDPFFRDAPQTGTVAVTSLPLKLFGTRLDQGMGRGSAIIAVPDGTQNSYGVGEEIMPGVHLKAVAFDHVTIERGGAVEQLFLDQSVAAPIAGETPAVRPTPTPGVVTQPSPAATITSSIAFTPRVVNGAVSGLIVSPKGNGSAFAAAGLRQGDVLTQINGRGFRNSEEAMAAFSSSPGQTALTVERGGKTLNLTAKAN